MSDPPQSSLPNDLKQRLLAVGVQDEASLHAALAADPQLRADYESWLIGMTLQAFAATPDAESLAELVERAPILLEAPVVGAIENAIGQALAVGDEQSATALSQRLQVLLAIKAEREKELDSPLAQALVAFVQAPDDDAAKAIFEANKTLLLPETAEDALWERFEAQDETSKRRLEARRGLLHLLRLAE